MTGENACSEETSKRNPSFSQLIREIDVHDSHMRSSRMAVVPENEMMERSSREEEGTLISSPSVSLAPASGRMNSRMVPRTQWIPNVLFAEAAPDSGDLEEPLLECGDEHGFHPSTAQLKRARTSVHGTLEGDNAFEVLVELGGSLTTEKVMNILGRADLLQSWCDPIQNLVVTSASDHRSQPGAAEGEHARVYEGEWIEAHYNGSRPAPIPLEANPMRRAKNT